MLHFCYFIRVLFNPAYVQRNGVIYIVTFMTQVLPTYVVITTLLPFSTNVD